VDTCAEYVLCAFSTFCNSLISFLCAHSHLRAIYIWKQDSQSHRRISNHHWRACRSSTLCAVSTSNLSNRWYSDTTFRQWHCPYCVMEIYFSICILHLR